MTQTQTRKHPAQIALERIVQDAMSAIPREIKGEKYWAMTYESHDAFIDAVRACEKDDTTETRNAVRETGQAWKEAWMRAARVWREDQRARRETA